MGFIGSAKGIPLRGNPVTVLNYFQSLREELQDCPLKLWGLQNEEIRKFLRKLTKGKTVKTSKADVEPANSVELRIILPKRAKA